jgi:hypothetical protein
MGSTQKKGKKRKERKGKERKGKERKGKERKGKERKVIEATRTVSSSYVYKCVVYAAMPSMDPTRARRVAVAGGSMHVACPRAPPIDQRPGGTATYSPATHQVTALIL